MNPSPSTAPSESAWRTYLKAVAFSFPAIVVLGFTNVFMLPKLETIWRDAHFGSPSALAAVHAVQFVAGNSIVISLGIVALLALLEWRVAGWPRRRRICLGAAVFAGNTAVLVFVTAMLMTALMAAPALLAMKN
jgi:hypothetical protein